MHKVYVIIAFFIVLLAFGKSHAAIPLPKEHIIPVRIALFVNDITAFDERQETIEVELTLYQQWTDKRLAFDAEATGTSIKYYYNGGAEKKLNSIWHPNIVIAQIRGSREVHKVFLTISSTGIVTLVERFNADIETVIDMKRFPFDKQNLNISFIPFMKKDQQLQFIIDSNMQGIASNAHRDEWSISGYTGSIKSFSSVIAGKNVPSYVFTIHYQREWMFYLFKLLIPLCFMVVLSWSVVWLKNQAIINSVAVAYMALLTIVAFQWVMTNAIPHVSYPTFIQSLILLSYISVGLVIVGLVAINNVKSRTASLLALNFRWIFPAFYIIAILIMALIFFR